MPGKATKKAGEMPAKATKKAVPAPATASASAGAPAKRSTGKTIKKKQRKSKYVPGQKIDIPDADLRRAMFLQIDTGGDGTLSLEEVAAAVKKLFPKSELNAQCRQAFHAADESGDNELEREEFRGFLRLLSFFNEKWKTFKDIENATEGGMNDAAFMAGVRRVGLEEYAVVRRAFCFRPHVR